MVSDPMSESPLVQAFRENERDLVQFLVARMKSAFAAQDIAQELFVKVSLLDGQEPVRNGRAYLFRMAANLAIDHQRRESRQAELLAEAQAWLGAGQETATPERTLIARAELRRLERALAALPPVTRRIFHLSRFEEKSQREIAAIVGLSPTAVFKHLRNAMDHLAKARDP